jgi:SPP1 family predicted phage head-tail adaptor
MAMNDLINVEEVTEARSSTGAVTETWTTHVSCYADIEQLSGLENFTSDMTVYNDIKTFVIYYESGKEVTPKMRISYDSGYYYITSVAHKDKLKTTLTAVRNDDE